MKNNTNEINEIAINEIKDKAIQYENSYFNFLDELKELPENKGKSYEELIFAFYDEMFGDEDDEDDEDDEEDEE